MTRRAEKLQRLTELAELRAAHATARLRRARTEAEAAYAMQERLRADRAAQIEATPDPSSARIRAEWLRKSNQDLRTQSAVAAREQAKVDTLLDVAREEEGRRQALARLSDQAS